MENKLKQILNSLIEKGWKPRGKYEMEYQYMLGGEEHGFYDLYLLLLLKQAKTNQTFILFTYGEMEIEELKDYYKARVEPYGKSMNELMEEVAKSTKVYKQLEEENKKLKAELETATKCSSQEEGKLRNLEKENKKLKSDLAFERTMLDNVRAEYNSLQEVIKKLKEDVEYFRQIYLDLKKMCEDDGYLLTDEEVTKLFNLDEIK